MAWPTVSIVEDERLTVSLPTRVLKAGRYEVLNARTGTDALALGRLQQGEIARLGQPDRPGPDAAHRLAETPFPGENFIRFWVFFGCVGRTASFAAGNFSEREHHLRSKALPAQRAA